MPFGKDGKIGVRHPLLLGCIFFQVVWGRAGTDGNAVHTLTMRGLHQLYSLEIDSAESSFDSVARMAPGDPRGPFFRSIVHFYLYGLNRDERELTTFLDESEEVIDVCDSLLDRNSGDATTKFYLGGIYGYRGLAYQTSGSMLKAARDGRKGYLLLEEAVNEEPDLYDACMGFGLFRYLLAKLPKSMRWILSVLGFQGDLEGGLQYLRMAADKGIYTRTEASLYLAQFMFAEGRPDTALIYLNRLRTEYPRNTLFLVLYAFWQHRMHNLDEAMVAARRAIEMNNRSRIHFGEELAYSTLGSIYFTLNKFDSAGVYYRLYMHMTVNDERSPNSTILRAGLSCELAGDRATALQFYARMREPNARDQAWDSYNYRQGRELLGHPLSPAEALVIRAGNELTRKMYAESIASCARALAISGGNVDTRLKALYGLQQAQFEAGQFSPAEETARTLLVLAPVQETWIVPHAWFKLGQTYLQEGRLPEARAAFEKVKTYDDYDFQDRLEPRVKEELEKLDNRTAH